ncbi:MAG TPA: RNA polymerase sigma factor [Syntrophomonadaceae bacterium]|nr:RNA polymerase sigma factor [Syntrophomonadaceae bacterium]
MQPDEAEKCWPALQNGDNQAVEIFVNEYYPGLLNFLLRLGCNPGDAEDVIQEAFIKAIRGLHRYQHQEHLRAWLFKICHNCWRDYCKKASRRREVAHEPGTLRAFKTDNTESQFMAREQAHRVQTALNRLPPKQRVVIILRYYHGFSIKEIAHIARCPAGTVKSRLNGALNSLRSFMEESDWE